jgi:hypothetical protein
MNQSCPKPITDKPEFQKNQTNNIIHEQNNYQQSQ